MKELMYVDYLLGFIIVIQIITIGFLANYLCAKDVFSKVLIKVFDYIFDSLNSLLDNHSNSYVDSGLILLIMLIGVAVLYIFVLILLPTAFLKALIILLLAMWTHNLVLRL